MYIAETIRKMAAQNGEEKADVDVEVGDGDFNLWPGKLRLWVAAM
jgi:hypothetical protein